MGSYRLGEGNAKGITRASANGSVSLQAVFTTCGEEGASVERTG